MRFTQRRLAQTRSFLENKRLYRLKQSNSVHIRSPKQKLSESKHSLQYVKANMDMYMVVRNLCCNCIFTFFAIEFVYDIQGRSQNQDKHGLSGF